MDLARRAAASARWTACRSGSVASVDAGPQRILRYYEEQGLLASERADNGYREYDDDAVERAQRVRGLIQAGLSTRMVKVALSLGRSAHADLLAH